MIKPTLDTASNQSFCLKNAAFIQKEIKDKIPIITYMKELHKMYEIKNTTEKSFELHYSRSPCQVFVTKIRIVGKNSNTINLQDLPEGFVLDLKTFKMQIQGVNMDISSFRDITLCFDQDSSDIIKEPSSIEYSAVGARNAIWVCDKYVFHGCISVEHKISKVLLSIPNEALFSNINTTIFSSKSMWTIQRVMYPFFDLDSEIPILTKELTIIRNGFPESVDITQLRIKEACFYKGSLYKDNSSNIYYDLGPDKNCKTYGVENAVGVLKLSLVISDDLIDIGYGNTQSILKMKSASGSGLSLVCIQHSINCFKYEDGVLEQFMIADYGSLARTTLKSFEEDDIRTPIYNDDASKKPTGIALKTRSRNESDDYVPPTKRMRW